jgi:hypothetical protein
MSLYSELVDEIARLEAPLVFENCVFSNNSYGFTIDTKAKKLQLAKDLLAELQTDPSVLGTEHS